MGDFLGSIGKQADNWIVHETDQIGRIKPLQRGKIKDREDLFIFLLVLIIVQPFNSRITHLITVKSIALIFEEQLVSVMPCQEKLNFCHQEKN